MRTNSPFGYVVLYALLYGAFGLVSPFMPRLLESRGLTQTEIGTVLAAGLVMRLAAGPIVSRLADRSGRRRAALGVCLVLSATASVALTGADGFSVILLLVVVQAAVLAPTSILTDALTVSTDPPVGRTGRFEYGRVRGVASLAFVAGTLLAGHLIKGGPLEPAIWVSSLFLIAAAGIMAILERGPADTSRRMFDSESSGSALRALWHIRAFRSVIAVAALVYGSHAMYDAFAVIRWNAAGIDPFLISVLWSEAVAAEVVVFIGIGPWLIDRIGSRGAALVAAVAGIVRWSGLAFSNSLPHLLLLQPMHGLTFALLHLACMRVIATEVPGRLAATAQAGYAFAPTLVTALLMAASGWIYGVGSGPFLAMTALCAIAAPVAWIGMASTARGALRSTSDA